MSPTVTETANPPGAFHRHLAARAIGHAGAWATGATAGLILLRVGSEPGRLGGAALWGTLLLVLDVLADQLPRSRLVAFVSQSAASAAALPFLVRFAAGDLAPPLFFPMVLGVGVVVGLLQLGLRALADALTGPAER